MIQVYAAPHPEAAFLSTFNIHWIQYDVTILK